MQFVEMAPFPDIPKDKRVETLRSIGERARADFATHFPSVERWFADYDSLYILSFCAFYFCAHPEGIDPEAHGTLEFPQHYLEILQALALSRSRTIEGRPLAADATRLKEDMQKVGELLQLRLLAIPANMTSDQEIHRHFLRIEMMLSSMAIRNWAYFHQMKRVTSDLMRLVGADFEAKHGLRPEGLINLLLGIGQEVEEKLNQHLDRLRMFIGKKDYRELASAYEAAFPDIVPMTPERVDALWEHGGKNIEQLQGMLMAHADLRLADIYSFNIDDAARLYGDPSKTAEVRKVLDHWSLSFGDLREYPKDWMILTNPVHSKPFIQLADGTYYSALIGVLPHFCLSLLEGLIADDGSLRTLYSDRRAVYLEEQTETLFRKAFPNAEILRGGYWRDPTTNVAYENDLIVMIDRFVIIGECKSGAVTPPARRGAPDRLFETLKDLIESPSDQADRLLRYLKTATEPVTLQNDRGQHLTVHPTKARYYIPIAVTFEHLGTISSNLKTLREAGVTTRSMDQLALSMSLTDLDSIFTLLELEAEKLHYLARRREFEQHVAYDGDELDLLGFYLDNGFNIGKDEYAGRMTLFLTMKSKELDPYMVGHAEGRTIEKPRLAMSDWWRDLLVALSTRRPPGWLEASYVLLNLSVADQTKLKDDFVRLAATISEGKAPHAHNWVACTTIPERRFLVAAFPYVIDDREVRNRVMAAIADREENARGAVVIGVDVKGKHYPYSVFASRLSTNLFA